MVQDPTTPFDGRLRGPDFQVTVTGVSWPTSANCNVPNSGHRLVSFDVALTEGTNASTTTETATNLSLVVNGDTTALDTNAEWHATDLRDLRCVTEVANDAAPTKCGRHLPAQACLIESSAELCSQFWRLPERDGNDSANEQRTTGSQLR